MTKPMNANKSDGKILGLNNLNVFFLGMVSFLTDVSSEMIFTLVPLFLVNVLGTATAIIGLIGGLSESTDAIFRISSGWFSDRIRKRKPLAVLGYSLSTVVEILCASLGAGTFMKDLLGVAPDGSRRPYMLGHFLLAIDIEHFLPVELSKQITGQIIRELQSAHKAPGKERIYVAGEKEHEREARIRERGIPVNHNLRRDLQTVRNELGIVGYEPYF